jgi:hypothetical protein
MIDGPDNDNWNPKGLVRLSVEDYMRFIRYSANQSSCTSLDAEAIANKLRHLKELLYKFDKRDEYEEIFCEEWKRSIDYRRLLVQEITEIEQQLSCAESDTIQSESKGLILDMLRRDIRQSEDEEASYGHSLVDMAKQRLPLKRDCNPIPFYKMMYPIKLEQEEAM